jgi:RHS repeat-associated protein
MFSRVNRCGNGNRFARTARGTSTVSLGHDADGRRIALTLPNGVTINYNYDVASQLLGINYQLGNALLGNLTYSYDLAGRRTAVRGSYAQTGLPSPLAGASYNANNQLTQFGTTGFSYDANGNLTSDGTHTYAWDARNHLASISGAVSASFQYDPFGRRVTKQVGSSAAQYLYHGINPVQELSGGSPMANLLTGFGVDERFQRTDANGPASFLTDALRSTIALTGPAGNLVAQYQYDPYGNVTVSGSSSNPYQFTGRENDGTGLYYYRARYYNPSVGRFISEDPAGFSGAVNFYAYSGSGPTNASDPLGLVTVDIDVPVIPLADIDIPCGAPQIITGGGCIKLSYSGKGWCTQGPDCQWRAEFWTQFYGDIYVATGKFPYKGRRPTDPNVINTATALAHEEQHLWDDVQAVVRILERVEGWTFRTKDACESAVRISLQQALKAWMSVTGPTGTSETMRH